jgi:hypothetical protein
MNPVIVLINSPEYAGGEKGEAMDHHEAVQTMAAERYLLGELTPELRDAYEDHLFGCAECATDVKLGAAFISHAKEILPAMSAQGASSRPLKEKTHKKKEKRDWFSWLRPAIMAPAFACLMAIVGYQNLVVLPRLEVAASEPRLLPAATVLHGETRGGLQVVYADLISGSSISVVLPPAGGYVSYRFDVYTAKSKLVWSQTQVAVAMDDTASIWLPARVRQDSYKLVVTGITATGENIPVQQQIFELRLKK